MVLRCSLSAILRASLIFLSVCGGGGEGGGGEGGGGDGGGGEGGGEGGGGEGSGGQGGGGGDQSHRRARGGNEDGEGKPAGAPL